MKIETIKKRSLLWLVGLERCLNLIFKRDKLKKVIKLLDLIRESVVNEKEKY